MSQGSALQPEHNTPDLPQPSERQQEGLEFSFKYFKSGISSSTSWIVWLGVALTLLGILVTIAR